MSSTQLHKPKLIIAIGITGALLAAAAIPIILSGSMPGRAAFDQLNFHEPAIRIFAHDWPNFDLHNYLSATTPGYHILLAGVCKFVSSTQAALQLAGLVFSLVLVGALTAWLARTARPTLAAACALSVAASQYVFFPAVWLLPDNLGWLCVLVLLVLAFDAKFSARNIVLMGVALTAAVLSRQIHLWAAGVLCAAAWIGGAIEREADGRTPRGAGLLASLTSEPGKRVRRVMFVLLAAIPTIAVVFAFTRLWGGLTPPLFQGQYKQSGAFASVNAAAPAFLLALFGVFSSFFAFTLWPAFRDLCSIRRETLIWASLIGLLCAVIPSTVPDAAAGRSSGLWDVAGRVPPLFNHVNPIIACLSIAGAVSLACWLRRLTPRDGLLVLATLAAFALAYAASFQLWQRYAEPLVLILIAVMACRGTARWRDAAGRGRELIGPIALCVAQAALTAATIRSGEQQRQLSPPALMQMFPNAPASMTPRTTP